MSLTISYEKVSIFFKYTIIPFCPHFTPVTALSWHDYFHARLNMNLLLFPPALSQAKCIHESQQSHETSKSRAKAALRPHPATEHGCLGVMGLESRERPFQEVRLSYTGAY